ncbi:hypothetical protein, partial [Akkermansia sp.]|uniref:hypothetical protein n=1 Tax=Akkermansia sp. TaxID=1872421 RepID=UPI003A88ED3F
VPFDQCNVWNFQHGNFNHFWIQLPSSPQACLKAGCEPRLSLAVKWQIPYSSACWKGRRDIVVTLPFLSYGRGNNTW